MIESKAAFARRLGVNKSTITRAAEAGRLVLTPRGQVEVEKSLERWHATKGARSDVAARHAENRGAEIPKAGQAQKNAGKGRKTAGADSDAADGMPAGKPSAGTRAYYKIVTLHFENQNIKHEIELRRGLRFLLSQVKKESGSIGATVRAAIERIIDQTAPRLAVMRDDIERRRLIDAEVRRVRWMLRRELPRALRRMRAAGGKVEGRGE